MARPAKAVIKSLDKPDGEVTFQYNPTKYTVSKSVEWQAQKTKGKDVQPVDFVQGSARTVTMELFLDGLEDDKDVSADVAKLYAFTLVNDANKAKKSGKPRPPRVQFQWQNVANFPAVIKTLNATYNMFHPDGRPARATVSLTLQEMADDAKNAPQNPSSLGTQGMRSHRVLAGETLDIIAYQELGDATAWRYIAELNKIDNPFDLRPGQHLAIIPRE